MDKQNETMEINLVDLLFFLKKKLWILILSFLVFAAAGFLVSSIFITPKYTASTRVYVLNRSNETSVTNADFQVSNQMLNDYKVLITGNNVTKEVISRLNLNMTPNQLASAISVSTPSDTRVLQIDVTHTSAQRAAEIANTVREVASDQLMRIMDVQAVNLMYEAEVPTAPSSPNVMKNTMMAAILGLVLAGGILTVIHLVDDTIRTEEDVERYLGLSVLGAVPASKEIEHMVNSGAKTTNKKKKAADRKPASPMS